MHKYIIYILLLFPILLKASPIYNVRAQQEGQTIVLIYDLSKDAYVSKVHIKNENGTFDVSSQYLSGDINQEVNAGFNRRIVYDVLSDYPQGLKGNFQFVIDSKVLIKKGKVIVTSNPISADVYVDDTFRGRTPLTITLDEGPHIIYADKEGRMRSDYEEVYVEHNTKTQTHLNLMLDQQYEDQHPDHYLEPMYAFDAQLTHDHYVGLRYAWIPRHFGLDVTTLYGVNTSELSATVGPTFRLTRLGSPLNLQLSMGAGAMYRIHDNHFNWVGDAALRFGFKESYSKSNFAWWSLSLGARYYENRIMPTASLSLMPVRGIILAAQEEEDFPCIYLDAQMGYHFDQKEFLLGAQLSYIPAHVGLTGSFLVGLKGGWDFTVGPSFRLTTDYIPFDLQVYQGFGYGRYGCSNLATCPSGQYSGFIAESSMRFAFGYDKPYFGLWSLNIGCVYGPETAILSCGTSLPIGGVAALIAHAVDRHNSPITSNSNSSDDEHPDHYLEPMYAYDVWSTKDHYVGLRYGWIPRHFGLNLSALYGSGTSEISATLGPTFRLTRLASPLSLQLSLGVGAMYRQSDNHLTWTGDAALRFGFRESFSDSDFAWWSISLGARYYDNRFIPTASISLMPIRGLILAAQEEEDFPCIYVDAQTGYQLTEGEFLLGAQLSYIPSHVGLTGSFFVGLDGGWDVTAGPSFRLTTDNIPFDLQVYQGFGYGRYACSNYARYPSGEYSGFLAESSMRFAFGYKKPYFGMWSFSVGCVYGPETTIVTCGVSLPIVGVAALITGAALLL